MINLDASTALDHQLNDLLQRLCIEAQYPLTEAQQKLLTLVVQQLSQASRQGIIATPLTKLSATQREQLTQLPVIGTAGAYTPIIFENNHVWFNRYWHYEQRLSEQLKQRLQQTTSKRLPTAAIDLIDTWFPTVDHALQKQAVLRACEQAFLIISGGPGTGKTTTITRLLHILVDYAAIDPERILLAAPTGKAAMRMQEAIQQAKQQLALSPEQAARLPEQGKTLHRLLGYQPGKVGFRHHAANPLAADVVIVDEASMIDISLMTHLFEATPLDATLILLGDKDQLTAVETGSIFRDLCSDDAPDHPLDAHKIVLTKSWRFTAQGGIGQLAQAIRDRQALAVSQLLQQALPDITWYPQPQLKTDFFQQAWAHYLQHVQNWQQNEAALPALFAAFNSFRLLSPLRRGLLGTEQLNHSISRQLAPYLQAYAMQGSWFAGRPIMITKNDYRQELFNGDIGLTLPNEQGHWRVWFPNTEGGFRSFATVRLPAHETAWAMTIHKSQGSEFERVLLLLPEDTESLWLSRELLYTGITRARHKVEVMGELPVILAALQRNLPLSSTIRWRLRTQCNQAQG